MEQVREAKDQEPGEGQEAAEDAVKEAVLVPVPAAPVYARAVEQGSPTSWESLALRRGAPNVELS